MTTRNPMWLRGVAGVITVFLTSGMDDVPREAEVVAWTPRGGVVRFEGGLIGGAIVAAQRKCTENKMDAVPLGFFQIDKDYFGRDRLMTFQCAK